MPCLSGSYNPAVGPLTQVAIFPVASLQQAAGSSGGLVLQDQNIHLFNALIDTGATNTCISTNVVQTAGLSPTGKTNMLGATGQSIVDQFTFVAGFLIGAQQQPTGSLSGSMVHHIVQGCEWTNGGTAFDVLIGRDIICKGSFSLSFDGHYLLTF